MSHELVQLTLQGPVASVRLHRPEVHNAFDSQLIAELTRHFDQLAVASDVRVVVLSGAGRSFCAGADLNFMQRVAAFTREENLADARALFRMFSVLESCPKPTIARVHGAALGGGMGLVSACDIVVASRAARFGFTEARLGLAPAVISPFVVRRIGPGPARELFLTARQFSADEAFRLGLVHRVVEDDRLDDEVQGILADLLRGAPGAHSACKRLIAEIAPLGAPLETFTTSLIAELRASDEGREGMQAFFERRPAAWVVEPPPRTEVA